MAVSLVGLFEIDQRGLRMSEGKAERGMDRRTFLAGSAAAGIGLGMAQAGVAESAQVGAASRPNVIVYIADQFRADFVGANGQNSATKTPNLDAMAARGTNFWGRSATSRCARRRGRC